MHMERSLKSEQNNEASEVDGSRGSQTRKAIALLAPKPIKASVGLFASSSYMINPRQSQAFNKDYFYSNFIYRESSQEDTSSEVQSQREIEPEDQDSVIYISEIGRNHSKTGSYDFQQNPHSMRRQPSSRSRWEVQQRPHTGRNSEEIEEFSSQAHLRDLITSENEIASIFARGLRKESQDDSAPLQIERVSNPLAVELERMNQKFLQSSQESNTTLATTADSDYKLSCHDDFCEIPNMKLQSSFFFQQEHDASMRGLEDLVSQEENRLRESNQAACQLEDNLHFATQRYY